eukprot:TRINITY_DN6905_c1_g1_i1.p1 TRINITY_DN6905_c1_g1~~TRINITY_DN6905_c1_g1_i1.p1  ORF type:complete len:435 (-),score=155.96 TRINITY_DN6905_c1_g1_i1:1120-2424(-)
MKPSGLMDLSRPGLLNEPPLSTWLDYESFQNFKYEDEDNCMYSEDSIIQTSDLETSFKEMENIQEVTETETLKRSIIEEMFPEDISQVPLVDNWSEGDQMFEENKRLIDKVETYLTSVSGEPTKIEDDILARSWQLSDLPSPGSMITMEAAATTCQAEQLQRPLTPPNVDVTSNTAPVVVGEFGVDNLSSVDADKIFSSLMTGNVVENIENKATVTDNGSLSNSFTTVNPNGEKVIIVIAPPCQETVTDSAANMTTAASNPPEEAKYTQLLSPPPSSVADYMSGSEAPMSPADSALLSPRSTCTSTTGAVTSDDDEEWKPPSFTASRPGKEDDESAPKRARKKYERKIPSRGPLPGPYPVNKVERKKAQNRNAAWRYREKKKQELVNADTELEQLMNRNMDLKKHLSDVELQMKCLMQLMTEAGLGKLLTNIKI